MAYTYDYPRPMFTVDIIILRKIEEQTQILLIQRGREPFKDSWALPGGFIEMDETLEQSAYRELAEETAITEVSLQELKTYGDPGRDPRGRTISVVFGGYLKTQQQAQAGDDAAQAKWYFVDELPSLAFDHQRIIQESLGLLGVCFSH